MSFYEVRTHSWQNKGRAVRWSYTLIGATDGVQEIYVSDYKFHSEASARRAGEEDGRACEALLHKENT